MPSQPPSTSAEWRRLALRLIREASTLTLATADRTGPWSAPVYYLFRDDRFYFFSSPQSRHIQLAQATGRAAASLYHEADSWQAIRGIQMTGRLEIVRSTSVALGVIAAYLRRFPFTGEFFPDHSNPDLEAFFSRFKTRLYVFVPSNLFYTDNRFGFATRQPIDWNPDK